MFSQLFAPQPRRSIDDPGQVERHPSPHSRSQSTDMNPTSPGSNLRKSSLGTPISPSRTHKSTLEERLRAAAFAIGEASNSNTPLPSTRGSPAPRLATSEHPLSPSSTPLPESPIVSSSMPTAISQLSSDASRDPTPQSATEAKKDVEYTSADVGRVEEVQGTGEATKGGATDSHSDTKPSVVEAINTADAQESQSTAQEARDEMSDGAEAPMPESDLPMTEPLGIVQEETEPEVPLNVAPEETKEAEVAATSFTGTEDASKPTPADSTPPPVSPTHAPASSSVATVEELQERLKLVEQRFTDVSTSFKRLQAEKSAADVVLQELTPLESMRESDALRDYLKNVVMKVELSQEEIKRLNGKLQTQDGRIEELRDTHRLESRSQSDLIDNLRKQLEESELLLKASQGSVTQGADDLAQRKTEIVHLNAEVVKAKEMVKEEEEKRIKAISLLKSVRQKLVKAEKDRDDAIKETAALKEREKSEQAREDAEKSKLQSDIESLKAERDRTVSGLKAQYDRELAATKERHEKELAAVKAELELDAVTSKATHAQEMSTKSARISQLENSLNAVVRDKNSFFDQLQLRQAELESSQAHLESLQSQNAELQHQLREHEDRVVLLNEELSEARREASSKESGSSEDAARLLATVEAKYEGKLSELKRVLSNIEKERNESDAEWSRKLREKNKETENLSRLLGTATKSKEQDEGVAGDLKVEITRLQEQIQENQKELSSLHEQIGRLKDNETSAAHREDETEMKIKVLEQKLEEGKSRESQLRTNNKTLREELRKVQSSAALLDRQRNPGVGYWTNRGDPASASSDSVTSPSSPPPNGRAPAAETAPTKDEEEVNLEYLRNVILQFLEHKEMRPNLVRVLSIILHFTPQETRRLLAKV